MSRATVVHALAALAVGGCSGCRDDHPYVPYAIGSESARAPAGPSSAPSGSSASADRANDFPREVATPAPTGLTNWTVEGASLQAPDGTTFVSALVRDFDDDGSKDAFAIVRSPDASDVGRVVFFHGKGGAGATEATGTFDSGEHAAREADCGVVQKLSLVGVRAVEVELGSQCSSHAGSRWFAVLAAQATARVRLAATIADPPSAPSLAVQADTADRDGDGLADMALQITLEGGGPPFEPGPRVSATLAWLDRPAGLSRDAAATEASFGALAASAAARARSAKEAALVPPFTAQARALWHDICADSGSPRLVGVVGTGAIPCGTGRALEDLDLAEARAYVSLGDPLRALLAIDRAQRPPASHTRARIAEAQGWLSSLAPQAVALTVRNVAAVPDVATGHEPTWGPLAFEPTGKLLVRTRAGVVRVDPDEGDETAAADVAPWPRAVTAPDGSMQWIEAYDPCDGLAVRATFAPPNGDDMRDVALPVAPPLADRCTGSRGAPARTMPVAWGTGGLQAIVDGQPVLVASDLSRASPLAAFLDSPPVQGSPRSPDGKSLVVPTTAGLFVRASGRASVRRAAALDATYSDQRDCAVSDDGTRVACVHDGKAWVGIWPGP